MSPASSTSAPGPAQPELVLASSSPYRRELLARLGLPFRWDAPEIDERPLAGEDADATTLRLAAAKARAVAPRHPGALVIASDQLCSLEGRISGKPGTSAAAVETLRRASGKAVAFHTALVVLDTRSARLLRVLERYTVHFRDLSMEEIEDYVRREQPLDCAGAFKSEGLGIALFSRLQGEDPNALVGLPLIALCALLRQCGVPVLGAA
jgi:MAF protein